MAYGVVYLLTNLVNGKHYIGQTVNYAARMRFHSNSNLKNRLSCAIRSHGWINFSREILGHADDQGSLDNLEKLWIIVTNAINVGYNLKGGGANGKHSKETLLKMSKAHEGRVYSRKAVDAMRTANLGKPKSAHVRKNLDRNGTTASLLTRKKLSMAKKGTKRSHESIEKCRQSMIKYHAQRRASL
jgi:group I intron endonuclease